MSTTPPRTLEQWAEYISGLSSDDLRSKARAANSIRFVDDLLEDGYSPDEVESLFILIARHLDRAGQMLPDAGLYSYRRMATQVPPIDVPLPEMYEGEAIPDDVDLLEASSE